MSKLPKMAEGGISSSGGGSVSIDYNAIGNAVRSALQGLGFSININSACDNNIVVTNIYFSSFTEYLP